MAGTNELSARIRKLTLRPQRPRLDRRLLVENLETRALLSADIQWLSSISVAELGKLTEVEKSQVVPSHFYSADGHTHGMVILSDRLAISRSQQLEGPHEQEVFESLGLTELRPLTGNFSVYASAQPVTEALVSSLTANGWADKVVPVFGLVDSQSEAVLLNEVIVSLPAHVQPSEYFAQSEFSGYRPLLGTPDQFVATLSAGYGEQALATINELSGDSRVSWSSPNFYQNWQRFQFFPNDPRLGNQWHLHNTGQGGGLVDADPNLPEAWQVFQPAGPPSSIVIGVVDDGVANNHPDLFNRANPGEIAGDGQDNDGNGWIDDVNGWNFVSNNNTSQPNTSTDNHGTSVAGVAAARGNNGIGVAGSSYNSSVISSRIFEGNSVASDANIASSIYYTAGRTQNGLGTWSAAHIVNHSWGGGGASTAITGAVAWATTSGRGGLGVPQLFAAGNSFGSVIYPATLSLSNPGVIAVGAMNNFGEKSDYSSFGAPVDFVTPSNDTRAGYLAIDTTDRLGSAGYNSSDDYTGTGSAGFGGTSSATPLATGIGALALARAQQLGINLTASDLKALMRNNTKLAGSTAYTLPSARNDLMGHGLLNAESLVKGIGRAQISVTSDKLVLDSGEVANFGSAIVGGVNEMTFRVRNQGTSTLNLTGLSIASTDFLISQGLGVTSLALGESTTFVVRFSPTSAGLKSGTINLLSNDSQLPSLDIDVNGLAQATTVSGFFFEDRDGDGTYSVDETTLAGNTVFIDQNSNGVFDPAIQSFNQTNSTPAPIFDNQTTTSVITVSGMTALPTDVNVTVNLTHTYLADLIINLVAPDGTRIQMFNRRGGGSDNLINTVFDDQATQPISAGSAPFTGSFRPEQALSVLNTKSPLGNWTLEVSDNAGADTGTLNSWTLSISAGERSTTTDPFGFYYFLDVPVGSYSAVGVIPSDWTGSGTGQHPFTVTGPNDSFANRHFGMGKNNRFYARVFEDLNGNGVVNPNEVGLDSRTIFLDANSNGIFDPPTEINLTNSTTTPINDNSTIEMPIVVSGFTGVLSDVDVSLNLTHTYVGDLEISLISPLGTQIMLSNRRGGGGDNFTGTRFDDSASQGITAGSPPYTGSFRPEGSLSQLNGLGGNGTWFVRIRDLANADVGTFLNWTLHLKTQTDLNVSTDGSGWASLDLPPGTSTISLLEQAGWEFTLPVSGSRQGTANGIPLFNQLYGTRQPTEAILDSFVYHAGYSGSGSAIDSGKSLAKEGDLPQLLTFENLINTSRGINGVGFELQSVPGGLSASDFVFQMSPTGAFLEGSNPPASWANAPLPASIQVTQGATDQILIQWPDNAIADRWLRITVLANANTGLSQPEIYYIGHLLGETTGPSGSVFTVSFADITPIRGAVGLSVGSESTVDIDKNGTVAFADISAMRANVGAQLTILTIPGSGGGSGSMAGIPGDSSNTVSWLSSEFDADSATPAIASSPSMVGSASLSQLPKERSSVWRAQPLSAASSSGQTLGQPVQVTKPGNAGRYSQIVSSKKSIEPAIPQAVRATAVDDFFAELAGEDSIQSI
jgi:large repetitive protein